MTIVTNIDRETYINYWLPIAYKHQGSGFGFYLDGEQLPKVERPPNVRLYHTKEDAIKGASRIVFLTQKDLVPTYQTMVYLEDMKDYKYINPKIQKDLIDWLNTKEDTNSFTFEKSKYINEKADEYRYKYNLTDETNLTVYRV
tara:strand:+ start:1334 stop:1762 length:429 start_codon:yes stop_codon:yes gene_type:complete